MAKYHNKKVYTTRGKFDSKKEFKDYSELLLREKAGLIRNLQRQVAFEIIPTVKTSAETLRKIVYVADFYYYDNELNSWVVYEAKGFKTDVYNLKKRLFLLKYPDIIFIEKGKQTKVYKTIS